ncbi:MAG TPA: amidohydrolase, partial [Chloroflexota bacterium]|nr:amidohydrolase [Chloroflexota bacterium]
MLAIVNGRLIDPPHTPYAGTVLVDAGRIVAAGPSESIALPPGARTVDAGGNYVAPGFIDVHV